MRIEGLDQATGLAYAHERDTSLYVDGLHAHRYRLQALHGDWTGAEAGLPSSSPTSTPSAPAVRAPRSPSRLRRA